MRRIIGCAIVTMIAAWPALTAPACAQAPPAAPAPTAAPAAAPLELTCGQYEQPISAADADEQVALCTKIIESGQTGPNLERAYQARGMAYSFKHDLDDAIADFSKVIELQPGNFGAWAVLGSEYEDKGDIDGAIALYSREIQVLSAMNPLPKSDLGGAYYSRGEQHLAKKDYDDAMIDFTKCIEISPKSEGCYLNRATIYRAQGNLDAAIADYRKVIDMGREYPASFFVELGNTYLDKGDTHRAINAYNRAIEGGKKEPGITKAYTKRCWARAISGDWRRADNGQYLKKDCTKALKLKPDDPDALDGLAFFYYHTQEWDKALADYEAALKADPKRASALYGRGMTQLKLGDATGNADIDAAKAINPDIATVPPTKFLN